MILTLEGASVMTDNITVFIQNSIRITDGDRRIYIDPFQMKGEPHDADYILITHDHYDHFSPEDIEKVNTYLANLNNKLNDLVENSIATVDEYYSQTAFANRIRIMIPATAEDAPVISKMIVYVILASELIVFILIFGYAVMKSILVINQNRK